MMWRPTSISFLLSGAQSSPCFELGWGPAFSYFQAINGDTPPPCYTMHGATCKHPVPLIIVAMHCGLPYFLSGAPTAVPSCQGGPCACWTPAQPTHVIPCDGAVACPPRISLADVLKDKLVSPHWQGVHTALSKIGSCIPADNKIPQHCVSGPQSNNKNPLNFP